MSEFNDTLERISMQLEQIEESLPRRPLWKRRLLEDLLSGAALANFWQNWCAL